MHTYRKAEAGGWQVGYQSPDEPRCNPLGPTFGVECEAAAYASFLHGGRYNPYEIEALFRMEPTLEDDASIHPDRPKSFYDDYPLERKRG